MREIQMVDLKTQYERLRSDIDNAIFSVISSSSFIKGPGVRFFEEELRDYLGVRNVISCANGTDALQITMMSLGLRPGDEVITTNFTFIATLETVALLGMKPVIVDPDPGTFNISAEGIARAITKKTRAIVPVHLFGQCARMDEIMKLAADNNLIVIEDAAQATGSDYIFPDGTRKKAGTIGNAGTTSFFPSKNLGCYGDGGAVYTDDDSLAAKIRSIANHGMKVRYHYNDIGVNSRLDTIQAEILRVKLKHLDSFNRARQEVAGWYDKAFSGCSQIMIPERESQSTHIFHQYTIRVVNGLRDELKRHLQERGIPSMVYYPGPLHMQEAYGYLGYAENDFPVTSGLCREVLSLPVHTEMEQDQLEHISGTVIEFFEKHK